MLLSELLLNSSRRQEVRNKQSSPVHHSRWQWNESDIVVAQVTRQAIALMDAFFRKGSHVGISETGRGHICSNRPLKSALFLLLLAGAAAAAHAGAVSDDRGSSSLESCLGYLPCLRVLFMLSKGSIGADGTIRMDVGRRVRTIASQRLPRNNFLPFAAKGRNHWIDHTMACFGTMF